MEWEIIMSKLEKRLYPPGSDKAIQHGCTCPVMDNNYGEGLGDNHTAFWYNSSCQYHLARHGVDHEK